MAAKCDFCLKGIMYGHNVSHSKRRTNRVFKPNLQYTRTEINGKMQRVRLCTTCIKLIRKRKLAQKEKIAAQQQTTTI